VEGTRARPSNEASSCLPSCYLATCLLAPLPPSLAGSLPSSATPSSASEAICLPPSLPAWFPGCLARPLLASLRLLPPCLPLSHAPRCLRASLPSPPPLPPPPSPAVPRSSPTLLPFLLVLPVSLRPPSRSCGLQPCGLAVSSPAPSLAPCVPLGLQSGSRSSGAPSMRHFPGGPSSLVVRAIPRVTLSLSPFDPLSSLPASLPPCFLRGCLLPCLPYSRRPSHAASASRPGGLCQPDSY
jgi:hypothetical protein